MSSHKLAKHEYVSRHSKSHSKSSEKLQFLGDDSDYSCSVENENTQLSHKANRKRKIWDVTHVQNSIEYHVSSFNNSFESRNQSANHIIKSNENVNQDDPEKDLNSSEKCDDSDQVSFAGEKVASSGNMWKLEDVDNGLSADFEDSLSGLGVDVSSTTYNMSDSLLQSLPSVSMMKHDPVSKHSEDNHGSVDHLIPYERNGHGPGYSDHHYGDHAYMSNTGVHHQMIQGSSIDGHGMCVQKRSSCSTDRSSVSPSGDECDETGMARSASNPCISYIGTATATGGTVVQENGNADSTGSQPKFQYILAAATSIISKYNEEPITYLNQGQPYEIIFKVVNNHGCDLSGKIYQSVVRVGFAERRLQYSEKEQIAAWKMSRPNDRIIEVDLPLSYGLLEVNQDPSQLNVCSVIWSPSKDVGVYIRVNSISTEFTAKKHGGEKGVPFQILIETWTYQEPNLTRLHAATCQIKVFKLKGAERKHKQDRDKLMKQTQQERDKYQPSYNNTVLFDAPPESAHNQPKDQNYDAKSFLDVSSKSDVGSYSFNFDCKTSMECFSTTMTHPVIPTCRSDATPPSSLENSKANSVCNMSPLSESGNVKLVQMGLKPNASPEMASEWLLANRFGQYSQIFLNFCGTDLLRLLRDDLVQICGLADGIRLYNALHAKSVQPLMTIYVRSERSGIFQAIYLESLTVDHLLEQIKAVLHIQDSSLTSLYCQGPGAVLVIVTDKVVQNMRTESLFSVKKYHSENCNPGLLLASV